MIHFQLCHGKALRLCGNCNRNADNHGAAALDPHQPFVTPATQGERCFYWMPRPAGASNPPRINTGE